MRLCFQEGVLQRLQVGSNSIRQFDAEMLKQGGKEDEEFLSGKLFAQTHSPTYKGMTVMMKQGEIYVRGVK